jgi:putative transposase
MPYGREKHHRHSIRLPGYDYAQPGAYFVTICTKDRLCLFGEVVAGQMRLNDAGCIVRQCWSDIPNHFPHVQLDAFIIMPNHVHGILVIAHHVGAKNFSPLPSPPHSPLQPPPHDHHPRGTSKTIGSVIRGFKIGVTKWFRQNTHIQTVWQRNYYEHIIRTEDALHRIREYIVTNPMRWRLDRENPDRTGRNPDEEMWFGNA